MKRIGLFLLTNFLVIITISIVLSVLGIRPYLTQHGIDYGSLMIFCLIWGMGGAFISLALSRFMAKQMMGVKVIDPETRDPNLQNLVRRVYRLCQSAGLSAMPEVGIYDSPEVNAFATGPTKNRSLVAVSTGLLRNMNEKEVDGVLSHEVAHIANGDMVTMTLIQGVVNAFVMFLARVIAFAISQALRDRSSSGAGLGPFAYMMTVIVLQTVFMVLGSIVVAWFSRYREYKADASGAAIGGRDNMVSALRKLQRAYGVVDEKDAPAFRAFKISNAGRTSKMAHLFSTHPPLEDRIKRLSM